MLTSKVAAATKIVNSTTTDGDYSGSQSRYGDDVNTLESRILWVVEHRADGNQRELSRKAGLSEGYVGSLLTRLRKKPGAQVEGDSLAALARAANVSIGWLITGSGSPDVQVVRDGGAALRLMTGWEAAVHRAAEKAAFLPLWVWERVGEIRNAHAPSPLTPEFLVRTALYVYDTAGLEEKAQLALDATRAEIAAHNASVLAAEAQDPQQKLR